MNLPRALSSAPVTGRIRSIPEDFIVEELPAFEASGEGEHLLLTIQKRGMNTAFARNRLHVGQALMCKMCRMPV